MKRSGYPRSSFSICCGLILLLLLAGDSNSSHSSHRTVTRAGHSGTLLSDGRWLFVGGAGSTGPGAIATLWDPQTGALTPTRQAPQWARTGHTATVLPDGAVLIFGGIGPGGEVITTAELFLPDTQSFTPLFTPTLTPRAFHSATLLTDGRVLLAGGRTTTGEVLPTAEVWDPRTLTSEIASGAMRTTREQHDATLLSDGAVLLSGGHNANGVRLEAVELYTPASQTFTPSDESREESVSASFMVAASFPESGATDVPLDALLSVRFSVPAQVETVTAATVMLSGPRGVEGAIVTAAEGGRLVFVTPSTLLAPGTTCTLTLDGIRDAAGNALPLTDIAFTTTTAASQTLRTDERATLTKGEISAHPEPFDYAQGKLRVAESKDTQDKLLRDSGGGEERAAPEPNTIAAQTGNAQTQASVQLAPLLQAPPGVTALSGRVLRLNGKPLARVTLEVEGRSTRTDARGRFLLTGLPAGQHELLIDGRSANRPRVKYGVFETGVTIAAGMTNVLPYTIWMPTIDTAHAVTISSPTTREVVVTTPHIPGLELHIPPNTVIRDHEGQIVTEVSLTPIPVDRPPFPLPANVTVPIYFTIQPGGAYVVGATPGSGAWLVYPNYTYQPPGARFNFWHYEPDLAAWRIYGLGAVTEDGQQVVPDRGVTLYEFTGAMISSGNIPPPGEPFCDASAPWYPCGCPDAEGDPVNMGSCSFFLEEPDFVLPGPLPIKLTRIYNARDTAIRSFGRGMMNPYYLYLWDGEYTGGYIEADLILPNGGRVHYVRTSPGASYGDAVYEATATPTRFYKSTLRWVGHSWALTLQDGTLYLFGENAPLQFIRDRFGNTIRLTWSSEQSGQLLRLASSSGRWISFTYNGLLVTQATDNTGRTLSYTYDSYSRLTTVTDSNGGETEYTYDANHRLLTRKDARGVTTVTNQYDATGRVSQQTLADGGVYQFSYTLDANGKITQTEVTDPRGIVRRVTLNSLGFMLTDTRALGRPEQQTTTYERDAASNHVTAIVDPLGRRTTYTYDALGNLLTRTQLAGTPEARTTTWTYGAFNQVTNVTDPLGHTTSFTYDSRGALARITNALGQHTEVTTNATGQITTMTDPLQQTTQWTYSLGDLASVTNPLDQITRLFIDSAGRLLTLTNPLGQQVRYTYDAEHRLTQVHDPQGEVTTLTYDGVDDVLSVTDAQGGHTTYTYDGKQRVVTRTDPLLRTESFQYDGRDNLTQYTDRKSQTTQITYDGLNRRTQVTRTGIPSALSTATYDAANQQLTLGAKSATFDANGNLATLTDPSGTTTYTWNAQNQLASISGPSVTASFQYDALGRRESKTVNSVTTDFLYDGIEAVQELSGGTPTANLLTGVSIDEVLLRTDTAGAHSFLADGLGSTLALADSTGAVQTEYTYEPFGNTTVNGASSTNPSQYTGRENDGTGLYYYRARYYHPELQRFISQDPIGFAGGDVNLYGYTFNDPINLIDPSGYNALAGAKAGGAAGGMICRPSCAAIGAGVGFITGAVIGQCLSDYLFNEDSAVGDDADRNPNQDKPLTKKEIKKLKDHGYDPHDLKEGDAGRDLFKDRKGNVYIKPKSGKGPGDPTGININNL